MEDIIITTAILFSVQAIIVSLLDIKYRDIKTALLWLPITFGSIPLAYAGYSDGIYPPIFLLISAISAVSWFLMAYFGRIGGADAIWLALISVFVVQTPSGHLFFPTFLFYLIGITAIALFWREMHHRITVRIQPHYIKEPIPYLAVISAALIIALVTG